MKRCRFYRAAKMEAGASSRASGSYRHPIVAVASEYQDILFRMNMHPSIGA